jgi:hypothetical protein
VVVYQLFGGTCCRTLHGWHWRYNRPIQTKINKINFASQLLIRSVLLHLISIYMFNERSFLLPSTHFALIETRDAELLSSCFEFPHASLCTSRLSCYERLWIMRCRHAITPAGTHYTGAPSGRLEQLRITRCYTEQPDGHVLPGESTVAGDWQTTVCFDYCINRLCMTVPVDWMDVSTN